jgi:IS5 family transposase
MSKGTGFRRRKSIKNWREYNAGLCARYDLTVWVDTAVLEKPERTPGQRGRSREYSDALIELGATLKALYRLPYRGTQGMMRGIFNLLGREGIRLPDYTTLQKRSRELEVTLPLRERKDPMHLVVDTTGLKVFGEGEWKVRQHGWSKRRTWRKLHLGVDERTQEIVVADLTENSVGDQEHLPHLLEALPKDLKLSQVSADGIYDTHGCYDAARARGTKLVTPPRKNAVLPPPDTPSHPRHKAIRLCQRMGRKRWKKRTHYHRRSLSETAMYRYKVTFGPALAAREMKNQKVEAAIKIKALNKLREIATPVYG